MLRSAVNAAAHAARAPAPAAASVKHARHGEIQALTRRFSKFALDRTLTKKQQDSCYSRIAAKLSKTTFQLSMEAIDRTVVFLQELGLSKSTALSAVAMHPMVRTVAPHCEFCAIPVDESHECSVACLYFIL